MSPLYRSVFNIPQVVVAQKRRSRALSSKLLVRNDSFPVYVVTLLTQAPCSSPPYQEACAFHVPCTGIRNTGNSQIRLIQT